MNDLEPRPMPADLWIPPTHLTCGGCGFHGMVEDIYLDEGGEPEPVCNCPIPATLTA